MRHSKKVTVAFAAALVVSACSGSDSNSVPEPESATTPEGTDPPATVPTTEAVTNTESPPVDTSTTEPVLPTTEPPPTQADAETLAAIETAIAATPAGCDPLDTRQCLLPFPSDALTADDPNSPSGFRVAFPIEGMPINTEGVVVDPTDWNRNDGFSPNASILTYVADLHPEASNLPSWTDLEGSLQDPMGVVLVDTTTGERIPLWAEPDVKAEVPGDRLLVIHPAISLEPSTTYAIGLQGLVTTTGDPVEPSATFRAFRDNLQTDIPAIEDRRDDMQFVFETLGDAGVTRSDLQLAWSFTTASTESVAGRMLKMRDETLGGLGDSTPEFSVTSVDETADEGIARLVESSYSVPNWLTGDGSPGNKMNYNAAGEPESNGAFSRRSPASCRMPFWKAPSPPIWSCTATGYSDRTSRSIPATWLPWRTNTTPSTARPNGRA